MKYLLAIILYTSNSYLFAQELSITFCGWFDSTENIVAQIQTNEIPVIQEQDNNLVKENNDSHDHMISPIYDHINIDNFFNPQSLSLTGNDQCEIANAQKLTIKNET